MSKKCQTNSKPKIVDTFFSAGNGFGISNPIFKLMAEAVRCLKK